jgi:hypothetical protein
MRGQCALRAGGRAITSQLSGRNRLMIRALAQIGGRLALQDVNAALGRISPAALLWGRGRLRFGAFGVPYARSAEPDGGAA